MKNYLIYFLLIPTLICAQTKNRPRSFFKVTNISEEYKIAFSKFNSEFELYQKPVIIEKNKWQAIENYDIENYSKGNVLSISPNKKFIILDYIAKGNIGDQKDNINSENYFCVIIDLLNCKVIMQFQTECAGEWNNKSEWIYNGKIIFKAN